jgi:hypothetical protein
MKYGHNFYPDNSQASTKIFAIVVVQSTLFPMLCEILLKFVCAV